MSGASHYTWAASTSDARALQHPGASDRVAACWYAGSNFTIDVNLTDGVAHQFALYALDWDGIARTERIDVLDADSGAVLDTRTSPASRAGSIWSGP